MEDGFWLTIYDNIAETIDDEILDYCDKMYHIESYEDEVPLQYYITAAQIHTAQSTK